MKKVMAFGTFDYVHPGHIFFLSEAKKLGDHLTVVLARSSNVQKIKGHTPKLADEARLSLIKNLRVVDEVMLGEDVDVYASIRKVRPDVIALGYDQNAFVSALPEHLKRLGIHCKIVRIRAFEPKQFKSTIIKERVEKNDAKIFLVPLAIILHNGKVFLQQRNDPGTANHKKWEFPGGSIEWGETPEECVVREVKEETGYAVRPVELLPRVFTNFRKYDWGNVQIVLLPYVCTLVSDRSKLSLSSREVLRTGWYPLPIAMKKDLLPKNREMIRLAQQLYYGYDRHNTDQGK